MLSEVEQRVVSLNSEILEQEKVKESLSLELKDLEKAKAGIDVLDSHLKAGERLTNSYKNFAQLRSWFRECIYKIFVDTKSQKLKIIWNTDVVEAKIALPFMVDISIGSRKESILSALELNVKDISSSRLYRLAAVEKMTSSQIAKELGVSRSTISKYLKLYNIPTFKIGENQKRRRGVHYGKKPLKTGKVLNIKQEQKVIEALREWRDKGKTYRDMAFILNQTGTPTKTGRGQWHGKTVHQILN
jgi:predicted transcriptional regulator